MDLPGLPCPLAILLRTLKNKNIINSDCFFSFSPEMKAMKSWSEPDLQPETETLHPLHRMQERNVCVVDHWDFRTLFMQNMLLCPRPLDNQNIYLGADSWVFVGISSYVTPNKEFFRNFSPKLGVTFSAQI